MPGQVFREQRTGKDVFVRDGKAFLRDQAGNIFRANVDAAAEQILSGEFEPATPEEVHRRDVQRRGGDTPGQAFGEAAAAGAFDAVTGLPRALAYGAEQAAKSAGAPVRGPSVADLSGRKLLEAIASEGDPEAGRQYAEEARVRAEDAPVEAFTGRVAGEVLGGGALARGAGAVGEGVMAITGSRVAGRTVAGITEGAALGYAQAGEDAYIQDTPLTAERALAGMGWGALLGGGFSGGAALVGKAGGRARALVSEATEGVPAATGGPYRSRGAIAAQATAPTGSPFAQSLRDFAEERTLKTLGARGSDIRKLGKTGEAAERNMRQLAREVLEHRLDDGTKVFPEDVIEAARMSHDELLGRVRLARDESGERLGALRRRVNDFVERERPELRTDVRAVVKEIDRVTAPLRESGIPELARKADRVDRTFATLRNQLQGANDNAVMSLEELTRWRQHLDDVIFPKPVGPGLPPQSPAHAAELLRIRNALEGHIEAATDKAVAAMDPKLAGSYAKLKGKYKAFVQATQIAEKAGLQDLGNRVISPSDYIAGAAAVAGDLAGGGGVFSAVKGAAVAGAHKAVREHGSAVLAVLADRMSRRVGDEMTSGIDGFFARWTKDAPKLAAAPKKAAASGKRVALPASIALFASDGESRRAAYRRRTAEVRDLLLSNGAPLRARMTDAAGELAGVAPKLLGEMTLAATRGAVFLAQKMPEGTSPKRLLPNTSEPIISDAEISKFARYWSAVMHPRSVLDDFRRGIVTEEQIEALAYVYPRTFAALKAHTQAKLAELDRKGQSLPYQALLQLDSLLGLDGAGEPTATPDFMIRYAGYLAQAAALEQTQAPAAPNHQPITELANKFKSETEEVEQAT